MDVETRNTVEQTSSSVRTRVNLYRWRETPSRSPGTLSGTLGNARVNDAPWPSSARARARELRVHPSSAIFNSRPTCVVYCSAVRTDREYMRDVTVVEADWLRELAPHFYRAAPARA